MTPDGGSPPPPSPTNLIADPGFEGQTTSTLSTPYVENWMTTQVESGPTGHNVLQAPPPNSSVEAYQTVTVQPNTNYVYSAMLNTVTASTSPTSGDAFIIEVRDTSNNSIIESFPPPITSNGYIQRTVNFNSGARTQVQVWIKT
jgi:hypothetical protein